MIELNDIVNNIETYNSNANKALAYSHVIIHLMETKETIGFTTHPNPHISAINDILAKDFKNHIDNFIKYFVNKHKQLIIKNVQED